MLRLLRALTTNVAAGLERRAANTRTGITLVEAVAADDLNSRLLAGVGVGGTEQAHEIRLMALRLMECGVAVDEIEPLLAHWHRTRFLDVTIDDVMNAALMRHRGERIEIPDMVHVHHHDIEAHAASINEGYETAMAQHVADDPTVAQDWLVEQKAEAWSAGVATALNHAITNDDGITLRLQRAPGDDRPWLNPYSGKPYPIGRAS